MSMTKDELITLIEARRRPRVRPELSIFAPRPKRKRGIRCFSMTSNLHIGPTERIRPYIRNRP